MLELIQSINTGGVLLCGLIVMANPRGLNRRGNFWLGSFLICLFLQLFASLIRITEFGVSSQFVEAIGLISLFVLPVSFYLSIQHFIVPDRSIKKKDSILFALLVLFILANLVFFFTHDKLLDFSDEVYQYRLGEILTYLFVSTFMLQSLLLWFLGYRDLKNYTSKVNIYSAAEKDSNLSWLNNVNFGYLTMLLLWIIAVFVKSESTYILANLFYIVGCFYIVWNTLKQEEIFPSNLEEKREIGKLLWTNESSQINSDEIDSELKAVQFKLLKYMDEQKPYLQNDLNLIQLSHQLNLSHHRLSHVLNKILDTNFSAFINGYRAEEAKKILMNPENLHYTMLQVAYESGYNSKTVFNTHFKKHTNLTPSQFRKNSFNSF